MDPEPEVPMILPKGIVRNTNEIYAALASFSVVPPEILWGCWHVYTNTSRKLSDPTAHRLENFWWHVLGSDRRYLSGRALARLFEGISNGPTFAPLRGPPNRYEGPPVPRFSQHELDRLMTASQLKPRKAQGSQGGNRAKAAPSSSSKPATKGSSSSSSSSAKIPPLHPILKNARGPSTSGPRPTARFVSPPDSGEESGKDDGGTSSGSTAVAAPARRSEPPTSTSTSSASTYRPEKKAAPTGSKKFVANTASALKRRPVLPRQPSSQSAAAPDQGSKDGSTKDGVSRAPKASRGALGPSPGSDTTVAPLSAKAAGKRPAKTASGKGGTSRGQRSETAELSGRQAVDGLNQPTARYPSQSNTQIQQQERQPAGGRPLPSGVTSATSVAATSNVAVEGQFDLDSPRHNITAGAPRDIPDGLSGTAQKRSSSSSSSLFFAPTKPSPTPDGISASKSQLTLLLERDRERNRSKGQEQTNPGMTKTPRKKEMGSEDEEEQQPRQ